MNENQELITRFYTAFSKLDYKTMQDCYHESAIFVDPVFEDLNAAELKDMWEMLCKNAKNFKLIFSNVESDNEYGTANWKATYTFSQTGRKVVNEVKAYFKFQEGKLLNTPIILTSGNGAGRHWGFRVGSWDGMTPFTGKSGQVLRETWPNTCRQRPLKASYSYLPALNESIMLDRRKFLRSSFLSSLGIGLNRSPATNGSLVPEPVKNQPIVISTWNFGKSANAAAWEVLAKNGRALDAVEAGVRVTEADPSINTVGYGGLPDRDGRVTLDACIMDEKGGCGSVMCLENIVHPVSVARMVMERTPHIVLAGEGALQFALSRGFKKENLLTPEAEKSWKEWLKTSRYEPVINIENKTGGGTDESTPRLMPGNEYNHDTIGMLAMDADGNLSGCCTTSGMAFKMRGRVGDSPIIGAGLFVDNEVGAATSTGVGEEVIRICGSHLVVELMRQGISPEMACMEAVKRIVQKNPEKAKTLQVGFLALNKKGVYGAYALQPGFTFCVQSHKETRELKPKSIFFINAITFKRF